jgi:hypothetical protein
MSRRRYLDDVTRWRIAIDAAVANLADERGLLTAEQRTVADRHRLELPDLWQRLDHVARLHGDRPLALSYEETR